MSFEVWVILQMVSVIKTALSVGLSGLALVPAIRMMQKRVKR